VIQGDDGIKLQVDVVRLDLTALIDAEAGCRVKSKQFSLPAQRNPDNGKLFPYGPRETSE
jgi:hypothetical protein